MTEQFANFATTKLNGGIDNMTTTVIVDDATPFPTTGDFRINIDDELMLVVAVSLNTFTVTRGIESTTAVSHADQANVVHILTAGALHQFGIDISSSLTVQDISGTPSFSGITLLEFDQTAGLQVASTGTGEANIGLMAATPTNPGGVSTMSQVFAGAKEFQDYVSLDGNSQWTNNQTGNDATALVAGVAGVYSAFSCPSDWAFTIESQGGTHQPTIAFDSFNNRVILYDTALLPEQNAYACYDFAASTLGTGQTGDIFPGAKSVGGIVTDLGTAGASGTLGDGSTVVSGSITSIGGGGTMPHLADFTWVDQGTASASDTTPGLAMVVPPASGNNLRLLEKTITNPTTVDWSFSVGLIPNIQSSQFNHFGIFLRDSSTSYIETFGFHYNSSLMATAPYWAFGTVYWSNPTTYNSTGTVIVASGAPEKVWLKCYSTIGSTIWTWAISKDGTNYCDFLQNTFGGTIGNPTHCGFYADSAGASTHTVITAFSWDSTGGIP